MVSKYLSSVSRKPKIENPNKSEMIYFKYKKSFSKLTKWKKLKITSFSGINNREHLIRFLTISKRSFTVLKMVIFTMAAWVWQNFKFNLWSGRFSVHEILRGLAHILLPTFRLFFSLTLTSFDLEIGAAGFKKYLNRIWILPVLLISQVMIKVGVFVGMMKF